MVAVKDERGNRYGRLLVIERVGSDPRHQATWLCECDCGKEAIVRGVVLRDGRTKSCGCLKSEFLGRLPDGEAAFNSLFYNYKRNARKRSIAFELSKSQFKSLTQQRCHYCGSLPIASHDQTGCIGEYLYNGIDRIDNQQGYLVENCVPCCKFCNLAKAGGSYEEFVAYLDRVVAYRSTR